MVISSSIDRLVVTDHQVTILGGMNVKFNGARAYRQCVLDSGEG